MLEHNHNPGRWVCLYLQEHDRVLERWREFWSLLWSKGQMFRWHPGPRVCLPASCCLQAVSCATWERQLMDCLTLPSGAGMQGLPSPKRECEIIERCGDETMELAMALQRCTVCSGMPMGMLCRAVKELCRCFIPMIVSGDLVNLRC